MRSENPQARSGYLESRTLRRDRLSSMVKIKDKIKQTKRSGVVIFCFSVHAIAIAVPWCRAATVQLTVYETNMLTRMLNSERMHATLN